MNAVRRIITCLIICESADMLRKVIDIARAKIRLDSLITKTIIHVKNGVESRVSNVYRLGGYFDSIELAKVDEKSVELIFDAELNVDSYLVMSVLRSIGEGLPGFSVKSIKQSTRPLLRSITLS